MNIIRRALAYGALTTTTTLIGVGALAGVSLAHTPDIHPTCSDFKADFVNYEGPKGNNHVTFILDGVKTAYDFTFDFHIDTGWSKTRDHTWRVILDANILSGNPTQFDLDRSGVQKKCVKTPPPTTIAEETAAPATTAPATTAAATDAPTTTLVIDQPADVPTTSVDLTQCIISDDQGHGTLHDGTPCGTPIESAPTSTVAAPVVAVGQPPVPPHAPTAAVSLPATGNSTGLQLTIAGAVGAAGVGLVLVGKRKRAAA